MTNSDLYNNRYGIVFEALAIGIKIQYKLGWSLFYQDQQLFQYFYQETLKKNIIHRSAVTVGDLMKFVDSLEIKEIKRLYGDIKLFKLQNKLNKDKDLE